MEHIIDIQLVKEQLRLLGHEVDDGVIIDFVKGLNKGSAGASQTETEKDAGDQDVRPPQTAAAALDISSKQSKAARPTSASVADRDTDAAPSKLQQAPDQQSPKRPAGAAAQEQDSPAVPIPQRAALDQRCRNFLSRCSDTPSPQQEQVQLVQQQQQQLPLHPVLVQVPHVQDTGRMPGAAGGSSLQSVQSSGSSELLLGDAGADTDSTDGSTHGFDAHTAPHWTQQPTQQQQHQQLAGFGVELGSRDSGEDSDSDGSSLVLEAEGSKFLLHQAATMQRVRARLAAKMAGYTAAASAEGSSGTNQLQASAGAAAARLGADSSGEASSASNSSAADSSSSELPHFGFRPGYKPVGIHMPPPPSAAAVEALAAARTLRQQIRTEGGSAAPAASSSSSKAGTVPPLKLDLPLNMQSLTSAVNRLHEQQQQQQQQAVRKGHGRVDPLLLPGTAGGVLHAIVSPGQAACASSVAAARASASIIGESTPCMASAAAGHKTRQSPRVDPLYLAPSSPRRSNPATPRSSPALSPAPMAAPLPAAAAGPGQLRSPAGAPPAAALVAGRSSGSSAGAKQSLTFSAGGRGATRGGAQQHHQQQQRGEAGGAGRRASSAPPTPSAGAPAGALRGPAAGGVGGSSANGGAYSARRSAPVSHESLYCQRLSSACGSQRSTVAPGVRRTDRVARFQQMQQQWARDRFLTSGAGGAAKKSAGQ